MTNFRQIFENDWCGIEVFLKDVLSPVFGEYEQGYDILTNEPEVCEKAKNANITEIRHAATFDFFGSELKVFDITVGDNKKLENNKVGIQALVRQYINQFEGALIIFHHKNVENQEWRFSYVEKRVNAKDSTSAKRYTYILGKGHSARTIAERFNDLESKKDKDEAILLPALTNAFSVAPLSDDFFNEYRAHYADLVEYISGKRFVKKGGKFVEEKTKNANGAFKSAFDGDDKLVRDFVKKMMGRLVFLHFLQKKGWLGVPENAEWGSGDKNFIYNLFKNADESIKADFLEQALEPLFFKTLNTDRGEDALAPKTLCDIYGSKIRIPYLNGGLFEEDELDKKKVKFKKEHFENLLEFFSQYNFTIDETDPDDQEIGVAPEMLGKIFENLLEDNKDKGAFYTPKEIVHYMCRESLIAYLEERLLRGVEMNGASTTLNDCIRNFVLHHAISDFSEGEKAALLKALLDVKICDPAVGSGAFPMGMLNELLACMQSLTGNAKSRSDLKKHIIKNNIYGVDIEKGAVDIARLRFWLAIIVDEEEPIPLPNLDYKIMQGNSLLESFEGEDLSCLTKTNGTLFDNAEIIKQLTDAINGFYIPSDHIAKAKIRRQISEKVLQLLKERQIAPEKLKKLESIDLHSNSEFFLWHTWFSDVFNRPNDCNGFDIVIGNPPYIKEYTNKASFDGFRENSPYYMGKMDLWYGFACHGIDLLRENGLLCFIAQNNWTTSSGAKLMRKKVITDSKIRQMLDFNTYMVFENADIQTMVMLFERNNIVDNYYFDYRILLAPSQKEDMLSLLEKQKTANTKYLTPKIKRNAYIDKLLTFSENDSIFEKIATGKSYLQESEATNGIHTHHDCVSNKINREFPDLPVGKGIFVLTQNEKEALHLSKTEQSLVKPYYTSDEIYRYFTYPVTKTWIIYTNSEYKKKNSMDNFPKLKFHLDSVKKAITSDNKPYGLHRAREEHFFKNEKIVSLRKCVEKPCFSYNDFDCYVPAMYYVIQTSRWNMKFLTGLLNSKLVAFWLRHKGKMQGENYQVDKEPLLGIPLPSATPPNSSSPSSLSWTKSSPQKKPIHRLTHANLSGR